MDDIFKAHRADDPETSREAAEAIQPTKTAIQRKVEDYALRAGAVGFTDYALSLAHHSGWSSTYRTRRAELTEAGVIVDSGRRERLATGRRAIVWVHKSHKGAE